VFLPISEDLRANKKNSGSRKLAAYRKAKGKKNKLYEKIEKMSTETMNYGGYYILPNIRTSENDDEFMDIYLLT
jgi:hypothetical protein